MAEESVFDPAVLERYYSKDSDIDLSWMKKPTQHQFRWRTLNNRWYSSPRRIRDAVTFVKAVGKAVPTDIYVSTSSWLNPVDLPRLHDTEASYPILLDHLVVFDIDVPPFSQKNMEVARKYAMKMFAWMKDKSEYSFSHVTFSGSKGFHLFYHDLIREKFQIPDPKLREETVRQSRKQLLEQAVADGHKIDTKITADTRRIIRLPGTVHGKTGWICSIISVEQLHRPFKEWMSDLKRHPQSLDMPKNASVKKSLFSRKKKVKEVISEQQTSIEVSTHVPGTKNRSALIEWLPLSWGEPEKAIEKALKLCEDAQLGSTAFWTDGERTLMLVPRAIPREYLAKITKKNGFNHLAHELKQRDHAWIRISGQLIENSGWDSELIPINILSQETNESCKWPWSLAHLELSKRMGLEMKIDERDTSGTQEPSMRIVRRE